MRSLSIPVPCRPPAVLLCLALLLGGSPPAPAEDGYELWLRYRPVEAPWLQRYRSVARELLPPTAAAPQAQAELLRALSGLLGSAPPMVGHATRDGAIVFGTPQSSAAIAGLHLDLQGLGAEGYLLQSVTLDGHRATAIAANG